MNRFLIGLIAGMFVAGVFLFIEIEFAKPRLAADFGFAFGCGRHYASNYDPADDPTDEHSKCYPSYKAWEKSEQWPRAR